MARFLLVHGAWGSGAGWVALVAELSARGHQVEAPDLPGHGHSPVPAAEVGQAEYVAAIEAQLMAGPPAVLVGHSMGGIVVAQVCARQPQQVVRAVYVAALLPQDGQSLLDLIRQQAVPGIQPAVRPGVTPGTTLLDAAAGDILCQDANAEQRRDVVRALGAQSNRGQKDKAVIGPGFAAVPRAYVLCTDDLVVTPELQRRMLAAVPCDPVLELNSGHLPQVTRAAELAALIDGLG